jgi:hypothetical protein
MAKGIISSVNVPFLRVNEFRVAYFNNNLEYFCAK